jgi:ABC-type multidrug transport system permease subunit
MSLVHNEQIKLTAGWLNTMASAAVVAGIIVPAAAAFYGVGGYDHEGAGWRFLASAGLWIFSGSVLHYIARRSLRRLQP